MIGISYFAWIGTFYLIILTWKDYRNNMNIDDRHNHFMLGIGVSLISHFSHAWYYMLSVSFICIFIFFWINKWRLLGAGDAKTISWIFLGFGIMDPTYLLWWSLLFISMAILHWAFKKYVFKIKKPTPFYIVILFSFVLSCALWGLYL